MKTIHAEDFLNAIEWLAHSAPNESSREAFSKLLTSWMLEEIEIPREIPVPPRKRGPKGLPNDVWTERAQWAECIEDFSPSIRSALMKEALQKLGPNATPAELDAEVNRMNARLHTAKRRAGRQ